MPERSVARSWALREEAVRLIPMGTQTHSKAPREALREVEPCFLVRGQGGRVWDVDGNEYLDFRCGLGPISLGHRFPAVEAAIREQLENGLVFSYATPLEVEVARRLVEIVPCAAPGAPTAPGPSAVGSGGSVRFLKTGGEAMAAAIKLARAFTGRDLVLTCGYHGWLQMSAGPGVPAATAACLRALPWGDPAPYEAAFAAEGERIAAVSVACAYADAARGHEFYPALRELTRRHGALLIFDEIVTGFRLARAGAQEFFGVVPDLAVFAKGISNGMPLSCYLGRREVMEMVRRATISSTFGGETLSLAAARAAIDTYLQEDVIGRLWVLGRRLQEGLSHLFVDLDTPAAIEGYPPCPQLRFTTGDPSRDSALLLRFEGECLRRGVLPYSVLYVNYSHTEAEIDAALARMEDALRLLRRDGYRAEG